MAFMLYSVKNIVCQDMTNLIKSKAAAGGGERWWPGKACWRRCYLSRGSEARQGGPGNLGKSLAGRSDTKPEGPEVDMWSVRNHRNPHEAGECQGQTVVRRGGRTRWEGHSLSG